MPVNPSTTSTRHASDELAEHDSDEKRGGEENAGTAVFEEVILMSQAKEDRKPDLFITQPVLTASRADERGHITKEVGGGHQRP